MNSTLLCRDPHSEDHGLVAVVWAGAGLAATLTMLLLLLTAAGARRVARRLHEAGTSCCSGDEDGEEAELDYSMYEAIPEEYLDTSTRLPGLVRQSTLGELLTSLANNV